MSGKTFRAKGIKNAVGQVRNKLLTAERMAMNKTATSTRGKVIDFIIQKYNLKKKDLMKISTVRKMIGKSDVSVKIYFGEKPIALSKFGGKWKRATGRKGKKTLTAGASAEIVKGKRKTFPGTFIAEMKSGHVNIFKRIKGSKTSSGKEKLKQYWGPSGGQLFASTKAWGFMKEYFSKELKKQINVAVKYLFK